MGASKRLAELILKALSSQERPTLYGDHLATANNDSESHTRFTMVRFGNVVGSSGSVIPKFRDQISKGGPLTVTHPEVTRYFMTIPEAAQLVIQASSMGAGGDVFVLDMGKPVKILDLATKLVHLSGYSIRSAANPTGDIIIEFMGLRPGEKLYEELLIGNNIHPTGHPKIMRSVEHALDWETLRNVLAQLERHMARNDLESVQDLLEEYVDGYAPGDAIVDWTHTISRSKATQEPPNVIPFSPNT
jgi:FlaA1/EpsC-like NDP-sugar epimerase